MYFSLLQIDICLQTFLDDENMRMLCIVPIYYRNVCEQLIFNGKRMFEVFFSLQHLFDGWTDGYKHLIQIVE